MNGGSPRGCGDSRDAGGIYLEAGSAGGIGIPMYVLIKDPVVAIDPTEIGLSPVGVKLVEMNGVWHVFDWVGESHYPNAADFLEEAIRLGLSRRISKQEDFSKLTAESRLILVHPKAFITDEDRSIPEPCGCPTGNHPNQGERFLCAGRLWRVGKSGSTDIGNGGPPPTESTPVWAPCPEEPCENTGRRQMPSFTYNLGELPSNSKVTLSPGIIMVAPIERIAVVNDPNDADHTRDALETAREAKVPVTLDDC
jgi:hypothetical protein